MTERGEGGAESVVTPDAAVLGEVALGGGVACSSGSKDWRRRRLIGGAASRCSGLGAELGTELGAGRLCASSARSGGVSSPPAEDTAPPAACPASAPPIMWYPLRRCASRPAAIGVQHGEAAGPQSPPPLPPPSLRPPSRAPPRAGCTPPTKAAVPSRSM